MADPISSHRARDLALVALAYVVAIAVAGHLVARVFPALPLWQRVAIGDLAGTLVVFAASVLTNNSSLYDPYWSVAPMVIAPFLLAQNGAPGVRAYVVVGLVMAWGARLTFNWARGWQGLHHEDWRYRDLRATTGRGYWPVSLLGLHAMPTVLVWLGCVSLLPAVADRTARPLSWLDALGFVVTAGAIAIEALADEQLRSFRREPGNEGRIMDRGLWARSRHPNYLGEVGFWWGLWLFAMAADPSVWRFTVAGPLAINLLFVFVSIPMLDRRSLVRRPGYASHAARVPALLPRPWRARGAP